jgi:hypothetical protein
MLKLYQTPSKRGSLSVSTRPINTLVLSHLLNLPHTITFSTTNMENLSRSPRLIYWAIEDTPEDEAFIHSIQSDIVAFANSDTGLLVPMTKAKSKK